MKDERKRRVKCNYSLTIHVERINIKEKEKKGNFNYNYTWLPILKKKNYTWLPFKIVNDINVFSVWCY